MVWNIYLQRDFSSVHEEKHLHMALAMEDREVRPIKTKVSVSWLRMATFSKT